MALARKPLPIAAVPLPASRTGSTKAPSLHPSAARARRHPRLHRARTGRRTAPPAASDGLARAFGVATALALAPVGLG